MYFPKPVACHIGSVCHILRTPFLFFINWTSDADLIRFAAALLHLRRLLEHSPLLVITALLLFCLIRNSHHFLFGLKLFKSDEAFQGPPPFPAASSRLFYAPFRSRFFFFFITYIFMISFMFFFLSLSFFWGWGLASKSAAMLTEAR